MRKVSAICIAVFTVPALLMGCQATPEEPVVVQKDMEQMIEKGMASSVPSHTDAPSQTETPSPTTYAELCSIYGVPERFKTSITEGNLTVNCDVAIELPETRALPMARAEAGRFSQEQVYTLFKVLCKDTPMYLWPEQVDKAYYEREILKYQQMLAEITDKDFKTLLTLMNPITPHITEELWQRKGYKGLVSKQAWPKYDKEKLIDDTIEIPIQINGKLKAKIEIDRNASEEEVLEKTKEAIESTLEGKHIVKEIYVPGKIVNVVVK
jgi:hypothetical protein